MAPTIQSRSGNDRSDRQIREKRSDFICPVNYMNTLPDIPFDTKFITYPFNVSRFVQYKPTSMEKNFKSELLTEHDLGIPIDLINPETYQIDQNISLDAADERLLEDETVTPQESKRSRQHAKNISWLRRTEYIASEFNRYGTSSDKLEVKVGASIKKLVKEEDLYRDRESQISAIEQTFLDASTQIEKHHSKPGVVKAAEFPVFPDFKLWAHPYAQVIFDTDPAPKGKPAKVQLEEMSHAMIRGMMDESGDQFVAYFLPTEETSRKRKQDNELGLEYTENEEYTYKLAREYGWTVKNKASKGYEENYFFTFRNNEVYYNELETRVRLNKRRKAGHATQLSNSVLVVKHREFTEQEIAAQEARASQLEHLPVEEDDDEEEEENEEEEKEVESEKEAESHHSSSSEKAASDEESIKSSSKSEASDDDSSDDSDT